MSEILAITATRHRLYTENSPKFKFYSDHYEGGIEYAAKPNPVYRPMLGLGNDQLSRGVNRYVTQKPLEDTSAYLTRIYNCPFVNLCQPAASLLAGTVGAPDSLVMDIPTDYSMLIDDCDLMGDSFQQFMLSARTLAAVMGHCFLLCDSSKASGEIKTQADMISQGVRPFFRIISPLDMLNWRLDGNGVPTEVLFRVPIECADSILDAAAQKDQQYEYRFWNKETWIVYKMQGELMVQCDQGMNPLHQIPIAVLYHSKRQPFLGHSLLTEAASYSRLLTNMLSDLAQTMETQSFSQACLMSEQKPSEIGVGASKVLHLRPGHKDQDTTYSDESFFYASPSAAPLQTMWDAFFRLIDLSNSSMSLSPDATVDKSHPESGISRAWRWHTTEKKLIQMALNEQDAAKALFGFAARWKGQENFDGSIVYGVHYDLSSLSADIEAMLSLQSVGLPATASNELKSRAIKKALPNLPNDKQVQIDAELKALMTRSDSRMNQDMLNNVG